MLSPGSKRPYIYPLVSLSKVLREYNGPDKNGWVWFPKEEEEIDSSKIHTEDRNEPLCLKDGINVHSLMVPTSSSLSILRLVLFSSLKILIFCF